MGSLICILGVQPFMLGIYYFLFLSKRQRKIRILIPLCFGLIIVGNLFQFSFDTGEGFVTLFHIVIIAEGFILYPIFILLRIKKDQKSGT